MLTLSTLTFYQSRRRGVDAGDGGRLSLPLPPPQSRAGESEEDLSPVVRDRAVLSLADRPCEPRVEGVTESTKRREKGWGGGAGASVWVVPWRKMAAPTSGTGRRGKLTADVDDSRDAFVTSDFAEEGEGGPKGAVVLPRNANDDSRRRRGQVLDYTRLESFGGTDWAVNTAFVRRGEGARGGKGGGGKRTHC